MFDMEGRLVGIETQAVSHHAASVVAPDRFSSYRKILPAALNVQRYSLALALLQPCGDRVDRMYWLAID
jgi:hypothetical protein